MFRKQRSTLTKNWRVNSTQAKVAPLKITEKIK